MKKALLIFAALFIFGGAQAVSAQVASPNALDESVTLGVTKSKKILDRQVTVTVLAVVEDSRCPKDVNCIQAGNAKVRVAVRKGTETSKIFDLDLNAGDKAVTFENWKITLNALTPYPESAAPIKRDKYMATIKFSPAAG